MHIFFDINLFNNENKKYIIILIHSNLFVFIVQQNYVNKFNQVHFENKDITANKECLVSKYLLQLSLDTFLKITLSLLNLTLSYIASNSMLLICIILKYWFL